MGHLSVGAVADVAVIRMDEGTFEFLDVRKARAMGNRLLTAELTLKDGQIMWDLNGLAGMPWEKYYSDPEKRN